MIRHTPRERMGITLTEILISILILGIGMVSLATLFPLGLLRLRDANRLSRSATLTESATADFGGRDLLNKQSFLNSNSSPWYTLKAYTARPYDPWVQDTPGYTSGKFLDPWDKTLGFGAYRGQGPPTAAPINGPGYFPGAGLPVAYDPLWRYQAGVYPGATSEARFASGIGFVRPDPSDGTSDPSAHGLQRITNFNNNALATWMKQSSAYVPDIFVSPEDVILQSGTDVGKAVNTASPLVPELIAPDLTLPAVYKTGVPTLQNDWKYTWMFTGQQADSTNGAVFSGDIVIFENRPFALNTTTPTYFGHTAPVNGVVEGETVVEAIFGYTSKVTQIPTKGSYGYGANANRAVLLRWSSAMPDPEIRAGSWIADVTYERNATVSSTRQYDSPATGDTTRPALAYFPYQRCHWYQIAKRTGVSVRAAADKLTNDPDGITYREMTVWVNAPLRAFTLLDTSGSPHHANAALVSPYVVNVFPRTIYTR
ncbi:hypothetical protein Sinac_6454 [Singulisphaera acidiphila DSM 18658]|uniref:Uncharacterized protein n=2 Tax=Singulisphaera acidiphila TaxID=466153 RepID=L0DMQ0_SINAD|nr:hypothetical protein Sinac_6454 [Singulisphaera acidiphila DSM 18658]